MDADLFPDDVAAWAVSVMPGSAVVRSLAVLDPRRMTHEGRVDAVITGHQAGWSPRRLDKSSIEWTSPPDTPISHWQRPIRLRLILDLTVEASARDLVARESGCCSFFTFTISRAAAELVIDIDVPAGQVAVLDGIAVRAAVAGVSPLAG